MTRTQEITLDVYGTSRFLYVHAKQDDNISRQLIITLTDNGTPIKPDRDTEQAVFRVLKPDGHSVLDPADIGEDGRITVVLSSQALACPGKSEADVAIIKGEEVISSAVFFIQVVRAPLGVHLTSENEFLLLVEATRAAEQSAGKADVAARAANEAAKSADASRQAADEAEALRQEAESKRINDFSDAIRKARDASDAAALSEKNAAASEKQAGAYNTEARSYAVGDTGSREGEEADNAQYYYEQAKRIAQGINGLVAMGTITFDELATAAKETNYMYDIADAFTTDDTFREGAGHAYPAGTNVYWTAGGEWDCLAGAQVVSVNGQTGAVTLTAADVAFDDGKTFQEKFDAGELTGPTGPQGKTGPQGQTGPAGAAGPNTVSTSTTSNINGLLKGANNKVAAAVAGTDYVAPWKAGNSLTFSTSIPIFGIISSGTTTLHLMLPLGKPVASGVSASVTTLTGTLRGSNGYVDGSSAVDLKKSPYTVTQALLREAGLLRVTVVKSSAFTNADNNTIVSLFVNTLTVSFAASGDEPMPGPEIFGDGGDVEGPSVTDGTEPAEKEAVTV